MRTNETPEQTAYRLAREILTSLRAVGREYLKYGETIGDKRVTIGVRDCGPITGDAADLPAELRRARPATRQVYRALRELRAARGPDAALWPADIETRLREDDPLGLDTSIHTINHALRALRVLELAWSHPERGYQLGRQQPRLPVFGGQSDQPSAPDLRAYASGMAGAGVRRFLRGSDMHATRIWVPGDQGDYGVQITDQSNDQIVTVAERVGTMKVPGRSGRLRESAAVRADLVRVEGGRALVRLPNGFSVWTRVLGDWHLAGRTEPPQLEAEPTSAA